MAYQDVNLRLPAGPALDLIMMGKSGHGKSSTGNSILGRRHFVATGGADAVTRGSVVGFTEVDGRTLKVVDIPGVCDTSVATQQEKTNLVVKAVRKGLSQCPQGFSALLLVLSYTARMTEEERQAIETLKLIFGEDILKKHTVCVFTHGDSFRMDHGDDADFEAWAIQQSGYKDLLKECGLYVLFENTTTDPIRKKAQLVNLVSKIDCISERQMRYSVEKFQTARELLLNLDKYTTENGLIKDDLNKIMHGPPEERSKNLNKLKDRIAHMKEALSKDNNVHFTAMKADLENMSVQITSLEGLLLQQEKDKEERELMIRQIEAMKLDAEKSRQQEEKRRQHDELKHQETVAKIKMLEHEIKKHAESADRNADKAREGHPMMDMLGTAISTFVMHGLPLLLQFFTSESDPSRRNIGYSSGPIITEPSSDSDSD